MIQAAVQLQVQGFLDPCTWTMTHAVHDGPGTTCAFIDSVLNCDPKSGRTSTGSADQVTDYVQSRGLQVEWILPSLPLRTRLVMGHDDTPPGREVKLESTVAEGVRSNIHVKNGISEDEFVVMRTARDKTLEMPLPMRPAVQVDIRAGELPPKEEDSVACLQISLNALG